MPASFLRPPPHYLWLSVASTNRACTSAQTTYVGRARAHHLGLGAGAPLDFWRCGTASQTAPSHAMRRDHESHAWPRFLEATWSILTKLTVSRSSLKFEPRWSPHKQLRVTYPATLVRKSEMQRIEIAPTPLLCILGWHRHPLPLAVVAKLCSGHA
jgi:hypothetical protein